jgi:hypothetical protein
MMERFGFVLSKTMRLAEALSDQYSTQALKTLAATLLEQVRV